MAKKKLLYVCPHLSTGGQPQYTYKQLKHFINDFEIEVVEINNSGGDAFVVQKNRIKSLVPVHTLGDDKAQILNIVNQFKPDIIHFQEIPQFDLAPFILDQIFTKDRNYFIVATTHGSFTNPSDITYHPDRYVLVSEWSRQRFIDTGVETMLWEYPIEEYQFDKEAAQKELLLDPTWKHVLNVGLFSPGKNQAEIFQIARQLEKYKIMFHFVGNQAMNYEDYWKPLMEYKPDNCVIWGERDDVDTFYSACDLFYFSSKLELNPLSVKEALSYKLPSIFRKLHTYLDTYDNNPLVTYIDDDLKLTKRIILETLHPEFNEIPGWFSYTDLYDEVVEKVPDGSNVVELGAWFGKSTNYLATKIRETNKNIKFTTIDTWKGTDDEQLHQNIVGAFSGDIFYEFIDNTILSNNYNNFQIIKDTSKNAANQFANSSIDFIMIDAGHTYESVADDLQIWYNKVKPGGYITGDDYNISVFPGVTKAANEFFYGQVHNGFRSFVRKKPRIQIKHLLTRPDDMRERVSIQSLKQLEKYGMVYQQIINEPYEGLAPAENCRRPEHISKDNKPGELYPGAGLGWMTGRHYGCYMAHRGALETMDTENFDYTLVFEADAFIYTGLEEFVNIVHKACFISERDNVPFISFADNPSRGKEKIDELFSKTAFNQDLAHCYLIPNREKQWWLDRLVDCGWDVGDLWFNHVFYNHPKNRYTTNKVYSKQAEGYSLLDLTVKTWS
jgi:predicted O-methyltransferase YrrM/GR25 family glycosyltransferase involved in LPS biosynthesis